MLIYAGLFYSVRKRLEGMDRKDNLKNRLRIRPWGNLGHVLYRERLCQKAKETLFKGKP
jgi:hypothetical protein